MSIILCNKLCLNQILLNLLSNATKFTQNGGTIIVRIIQKPYYKKGYALYEFHVRDNGIGMSREFQEHLFESFTREETSTVSGIQGTGLGMAINVSHMVQEIAMELLSNAGFSVSLADDGDVAVETLRTAAPDQFDLVLMDIQMPKLDGYSATRQIRTLDSAIAKVLG
ncbi:MAG: hybrid sensor histidine kinase/response regulator [Blautia sp.]